MKDKGKMCKDSLVICTSVLYLLMTAGVLPPELRQGVKVPLIVSGPFVGLAEQHPNVTAPTSVPGSCLQDWYRQIRPPFLRNVFVH